ncbi:MAG: hypothetical protein KAW92_06205 [Candidatus Cloacimonetes bacterium]|nr:hypothetical protein [Candidatus Cloacimonadota bacterium]
MSVRIYKKDDIVFAKHISMDDFKEGLAFFSDDNDFLQVGTWNYPAGKELLAHNHNIVERNVNRTQEVLFIRKGRILAEIYNEDDKKIDSFEAQEGDIVILLNGGHGYKILEDNTQVLEIKNGPYLGPEKDRRRI